MEKNQDLLFNQIVVMSCLGGFVLLSSVAAIIEVAQRIFM
ncbi:hypothetical protein DJ93_5751 [Bacillus clarus]|uniref:DUF4027 domain-containing protein n=1 Tax=Bacillus clarus TaxID=2338372 RepID=A0A090YSG2_9BACI|nr:hypothetical protein DJ93_5751 [Bacillus clarus]